MLIFYLFSLLLIFFSYKSLRGGIDYLNYFKRELARPASDFTPFCSIIAPCRGLDADLDKNLSALFKQDYPRYEIIFVVDSPEDESISVIEKVRIFFQQADAETRRFSKIIVAGNAVNEGQKVHNLREAVQHISIESEVFVFVDSDARPAARWLRDLVAPLREERIGAATGYRWFVQSRGGFWTHFRAVWNASIASALGANEKSNFCWGGSMAVRRKTFEKVKTRERWRGALSDDFAVTRAMREHDFAIKFVPQALTASVEDCSFEQMAEFTTRQLKITRVYAPNLWAQSFMGAGLFVLVWAWAILILFFKSANEFSFWFAVTTVILLFLLGAGKAWLRLESVKLILKGYENELNRQFWAQNLLWILTPVLFFYNCAGALLSRHIKWRGTSYEMKSPSETIVRRNGTTPA